MEDHVYLCMETREATLYRQPFENWMEIIGRFPDCVDDVESMSLCFALQQYTAAVFHSLLAVEHGLIALGPYIKVSDPKVGFDATYKKLGELVGDRSKITPPITFEFVEQTKARLDSMKLAWRNKVNHAAGRLVIEKSGFNARSSEEVIIACRSFMRYMAEGLPK